jgi:hypothetical protein
MSDSQAFIAAYAEAQHEIIALKQQNRELLEALKTISQKCPAYAGDFAPGESMSISDFGGNGDDLAYESALRATGEIGDIARAAIAKATGGAARATEGSAT